MSFREYLRTDLAIENELVSNRRSTPGVEYEEDAPGGIARFSVRITDPKGEAALGRPIGTYITLSFDRVWDTLPDETDSTHTAFITAIQDSLARLMPKDNKARRLLVVGLGNRDVTADALGPFVSDRVIATGHWESEPALTAYLPRHLLFSVSPGVIGKTGIETLSQIQAAVAASRADCVLAVDSLAARSADRLCRTIQMTDTGIVPGSGVGNHRAALSFQTLGVPVIAIGVPAIVSSSTLICDALEQAGIGEIPPPLSPILENGTSFFVTLKDCDLATACLADLVSDAIMRYAHAV